MKQIVCSAFAILSILTYSCSKHGGDSTAGTPTLTLSRTALTAGTFTGYTDTFTITSTVNWTLEIGTGASGWLQVDTTKGGSGKTTVKVTVISNNTTGTQTATLTISPVGTTAIKPQVLTVTQTAFNLVWQKSFGGSSSDGSNGLIRTADGGYISAGQTTSNDGDVAGYRGNGDAWIIKTDVNGNKVWSKTFGGSDMDAAWSIVASTDGGYVTAGFTYSTNGDVTGNHGYQDAWVIKMDGNGNKVWQKTLGGTANDQAMSVINTTDGGYLVSGETISGDGDVTGNHGWTDLWVVKLDASGNLLWQKTFGSSSNDYYGVVSATSDGGYILAGTVTGNDGDVTGNHGGEDILVVKLDASGNKVWAKTFGGTGDENAYSIIATTDGGYAVAGYTSSNDGDVTGNHGGNDMWILKLDNSGKKIWQKTLGGSDDEQAFSILADPNGGYMITGYTMSNDGDVTGNHGNKDLWAVKLDNNGNKLWQRALGSSGDDWGSFVVGTTDGGFVVGGFSSTSNGDVTGNHGDPDMWIAELK